MPCSRNVSGRCGTGEGGGKGAPRTEIRPCPTSTAKKYVHEARIVLAQDGEAIAGRVAISLADLDDAGDAQGVWVKADGGDDEPLFKVARLDGSPVQLRKRKGRSKEERFGDWEWTADSMHGRVREPVRHYEGQTEGLRALMKKILA